MNDSSDDNKINFGKVVAFLFIWLVITAASLIAGHIGGYIAGMRSGGWNIHMIYPPIFGGLIGLISYPILRFSLRIGSKDKYKGLL
jgi:hypothetical protein